MSFLRYLPRDPAPSPWGIEITGGGEKLTAPYEPYPSGREQHPDHYWFEWDDGRVLQEMALILIRNGSGEFESSVAGALPLRNGSLFFLHPDVWHRYRPLPETGYHETWVAFTGKYIQNLVEDFFPPERPVVHLFDPEGLYQLVLDLHRLMRRGIFRQNRHVANARLLEILARARQDSGTADRESQSGEMHIEKVCHDLLTCPQEVDWDAMARRSGMSLSHFRRKFRMLTGYSPHDYWLHVRINRIKQDLMAADTTLEVLAERYNFHDAAHLSKTFVRLTGLTARQYRNGRKAAHPRQKTD